MGSFCYLLALGAKNSTLAARDLLAQTARVRIGGVIGRAFTRVSILGPALVVGCASLFDGTFPPDGGAPSGVDDSDEASDADVASDPEIQDSGGPEAASDATSCVPVTNGLVGHWTMDVDSIGGTRLSDTSGNQNDGTLVGFSQPDTAPGRFGEALLFPATGMAYVNVPVLPVDQTPGGMNTISMWFYRSGTDINDVLALLPNSPRYDLWLTGGVGNYLCINTGHNECVGVEDDDLRDRWVHVVAILVNGSIGEGTLYIDGQNRNAGCLTDGGFSSCDLSAAAAAPVDFGGDTDFFFHGMLDEVRIYSRALAPAEVMALYDGTACP
jgi:Concanavalin A-like lectin/glucanases superfamily